MIVCIFEPLQISTCDQFTLSLETPSTRYLLLNIGPHFPIIQSDAPLFIHRNRRARIETIDKQPIHLLGTLFMYPLLLHHLVQKGDIEGDHWNDGTCSRDQRLVDRDIGSTAKQRKLVCKRLCSSFKMFLCSPYGTLSVHWIGDFWPYVGVCDCCCTWS